MKLIFKASDVIRCIDHAFQSSEWNMGYEEDLKPGPALLLVHDHGIYLMSNGNPRDFITEANRCYVVYANDCDPNINENHYVGGDDFVEVIPIEKSWKDLVQNYNEIHIDLTDDFLEMSFGDKKCENCYVLSDYGRELVKKLNEKKKLEKKE